MGRTLPVVCGSFGFAPEIAGGFFAPGLFLLTLPPLASWACPAFRPERVRIL